MQVGRHKGHDACLSEKPGKTDRCSVYIETFARRARTHIDRTVQTNASSGDTRVTGDFRQLLAAANEFGLSLRAK